MQKKEIEPLSHSYKKNQLKMKDLNVRPEKTVKTFKGKQNKNDMTLV
jgi:hypothetical protein